MARPTRKLTAPDACTHAFERKTRQRTIIRAVFDNAERPLSIEEVLALAQRGRNKVSLSTVYRFVRSLVDENVLVVVELPGQGAFYELAGKAHHHHFSCIRCGRVYELNDCVSVDKLDLPKGFSAVSHDLTVAGVCAMCNAGSVSSAHDHGRHRQIHFDDSCDLHPANLQAQHRAHAVSLKIQRNGPSAGGSGCIGRHSPSLRSLREPVSHS